MTAEQKKLLALMVLCFMQLATIAASNCKNQSLGKLERKLQRKGLALFKVAPETFGAEHIHKCNRMLVDSYRTLCSFTWKPTEEHDRSPSTLKTASCGQNCDPKCCAITLSVPVLKKQRSKLGRKLDVWVMQQQEIVIAYVRP